MVTLLFLTGLFEKLPEATLAAIVIAAVIELVDIASLRRLWRVRRRSAGRRVPTSCTARADFVAAAGALLGVLLFDTLPGLVIGIGVSLILLIARTSRPHVAALAPVDDRRGPTLGRRRAQPGLTPPRRASLVVRVEAPLMFANADSCGPGPRARRRGRRRTGGLSWSCSTARRSPSIDVTAAGMLVQLRDDVQPHSVASSSWLGQHRPGARRARPPPRPSGEPPLFATIDEAIAGVLPPGIRAITGNG